ncbi:MAG TPA: ATP-binding protein [Hyphomicrobiales bacterium]|nr:ATP-binding protein [Hyphomicrobiales bacterium]
MAFTNFRLNVVLRVLALLGNVVVLVWGVLRTDWQVTLVVSAVLLVLQVVELVYYLETTSRQLTAFFDSIAARDFSVRYQMGGKGQSFDLLGRAFNRITLTLRQLNSERAAQHQLLEATIEHISMALLCIDAQGRIILMNQSAKRLFNFPYIHNAFALAKVDGKLPALVHGAVPGESQLISLTLGGQAQPLSMFTTRFELLGDTYSLVSLQNIRDELESQELDAWQKLIKVLTHEIMNSVTPMVALSTVIKQALVDEGGQLSTAGLSNDQQGDLVRSLVAIEARGKGLMHFVRSYNSLANVPPPYFVDVPVAALLERITLLAKHELAPANIALHTRCEPADLCLRADIQQVEQVLINLMKNAREAMAGREDGRIAIEAGLNPDRDLTITVTDNGEGIAADKLQDIFIPFYTSKKQGSGIGLSISRQLMLANKGHIQVSSQPGIGTAFTLVFRQAN